VIAAGYLANEIGIGWAAASVFIGERVDSLKASFRRAVPGGALGDLWNRILELWEPTPRMLDLTVDAESMAAD